MQSPSGAGRLSQVALLELLRDVVGLAARARVTINAHGVPMMSQLLMQGLVL